MNKKSGADDKMCIMHKKNIFQFQKIFSRFPVSITTKRKHRKLKRATYLQFRPFHPVFQSVIRNSFTNR